MRCACIDIGSNTTRLLVASIAGGRLTPLAQSRAFTRLGHTCGTGGVLSAVTLATLAEVVAAQAREARAHDVVALRVVATAAVRRAVNGIEACAQIGARAGVAVEILGEVEEARLAFAGATGSLGATERRRLAVVDVGGGSSQVIVGTCAEGASWSVSLPLGSGDLAEAHLHSDPPTAGELALARSAVAAALDAVVVPAVERALAVGGSATSLRRLAGPLLERMPLRGSLAALVGAPAAVVAASRGIDAERVRLLPAGIVVLEALAERLGPLEIAQGGLREGIVRELARA